MRVINKMKILIIDGQGGKIGRMLVERLREKIPDAVITAVGTNSLATSNMIKGGVDNAATGENPVIVGCRSADIIVGPVGIVIADALFGEITPAMACAVGQSRARKILIPINKCNNYVVGTGDFPVNDLISKAVEEIIKNC